MRSSEKPPPLAVRKRLYCFFYNVKPHCLGSSRRTEGELAGPRRPRGSGLIELHCLGLEHSQSPPSINKAAASGKCVWWSERGRTHWSSFYSPPLKLSSTSGSLAEEVENSRKLHRRELHQNDLTHGTWNTGSH